MNGFTPLAYSCSAKKHPGLFNEPKLPNSNPGSGMARRNGIDGRKVKSKKVLDQQWLQQKLR